MTTSLSKIANQLIQSGLSIIPTQADKKPAVPEWTSYQKNIPDQAKVKAWFSRQRNIAAIAGKVSGGLEILDFDCQAEALSKWTQYVQEYCPGLVERLIIELSPNGAHVGYKCTQVPIPGNTKLARKYIEVAGPGEHSYRGKKFQAQRLNGKWCITPEIIETRGEGGYCLIYPSKGYDLKQGDFRAVPIQKNRLAKIIEEHNIKSGKKAEAVGDVIEYVSGRDAWRWNKDKLLKDSKIIELTRKFKGAEREQIVEASMKLRRLFQNLLDNQNHGRKLRKQKPVPYRKFYRPWIRETNLWSKLFGLKTKPKELMQAPEMPDFIYPNQPFNPRAMAREALMSDYPKQRNIIKLMADYIDTAAKDIFDTNIVHSNKIHVAVIRSRGLENAASALDRWTSEYFAGVKPRGSRWVAEHVPSPIRKGVQKIATKLRRAVFPFNWAWNVFIQTSSAGITYARYGNRASVAGIRYFTDPVMRQAIKQNAYSNIIKSRWGGRAYYQDLQKSILKHKRLEATRIEKVEHFANYLTSTIEDALTGHAIGAAYHDGKVRLGLKGRALWEYASEGGAKTQSMYNFGDLPGFLRTKEVGQIFPFQTFSFEVLNTIREMNLPIVRRIVGKTGIYETISANSIEGKALTSKRLKMLARWTAAIMVTNAVVDKATGRKPWELYSFVPFLGYLLGGYSGRGPVPHEYIQDFRKGVRDVIIYGNLKKLRRWAIQYHVIGGYQLERTLEGIEAVAKGKVTDVRGRKLFKVKGEEEKIRAITLGPYRTKAGIKYVKKRKEKQGILGALKRRTEEKRGRLVKPRTIRGIGGL